QLRLLRITVKRFELYGSAPGRAHRLYSGPECDQGLRDITRIRRDTLIGHAQDGVLAIRAAQGRTTTSRLSLVAPLPARIAEIRTACPLQQIPPERCHVTNLRAGRQRQTLRNNGVVTPHARIVGCL